MGRLLAKCTQLQLFGYLAGLLGVLLVTIALLPFHRTLRSTPGLLFVLVVVLVATGWGSKPALFTSLLAVLALDYNFMPPFYSIGLMNLKQTVKLLTFCVTAITVGQLSANARKRLRDLEQAKAELERLYQQLQGAFERESQAEAIRRSEKFKSALLDAVVHELRTPLTSLKLSATTLAHSKTLTGCACLDEPHLELLNAIAGEVDRLDRIVGHLALSARIDAQQFEIQPFACSVSDLVSQALERMQDDKSDIHVHIARDLPPVKADCAAVTEVVYTLLENACKYHSPGTPIVITAGRASETEIFLAVENAGPGIPHELRERVFDKFYRMKEAASQSAKQSVRVSGLGRFQELRCRTEWHLPTVP